MTQTCLVWMLETDIWVVEARSTNTPLCDVYPRAHETCSCIFCERHWQCRQVVFARLLDGGEARTSRADTRGKNMWPYKSPQILSKYLSYFCEHFSLLIGSINPCGSTSMLLEAPSEDEFNGIPACHRNTLVDGSKHIRSGPSKVCTHFSFGGK